MGYFFCYNFLMKKIFGVGLVLILFIAFLGYIKYSERFVNVVKIISPTCIVLDNDQEINLGIDVLSFNNKELCLEVSKQLGLNYDDVLGVGYLADEFAREHLIGHSIILDEYKSKLRNSGFVIVNNMPVNPEKFKHQLKIVRMNDFVIYNLHSKKYHRLSCKYGVKSRNFTILPKAQAKKDGIPCKYCLDSQKDKTNKDIVKSKQKGITPPPLLFSTNYIKIFLTDYTTNLKPNRNCNSIIAKELINQINRAQSTIDIAIYGYDRLPAIEKALINAKNRGVKIRLVCDIDAKGNNIYEDTEHIKKIIPDYSCDKAPDGIEYPVKYSNSIMHDKFYIFDSKTVITGSANLSYTDMSSFNSNSVIEINSPTVARIYEQEFNQMFNSKFHQLKDKIPMRNDIILGDSVLSIYFSPKDDAMNRGILPLINSSKKYIYIPTFLITDKGMCNALIAAKKRGVDVKVLVDAVNAMGRASKHQLLRDNGILVKTENYAGKLHSKSMIIDDKYVVIGSMNFSYSGNAKNDENLIIIKNSSAAKFYRKFFEYLWGKVYNFWLTHDVAAESIYSIGSCSDGIDNDFDGKIDLQDEGCKKVN